MIRIKKMDFEEGDICKLKNGELITVSLILPIGRWCIMCRDEDNVEMAYDAFGRYNGSEYPSEYDIALVYKKDKYPEMYI